MHRNIKISIVLRLYCKDTIYYQIGTLNLHVIVALRVFQIVSTSLHI